MAVELAFRKGNLRGERISEDCHALDGGSSKAVMQVADGTCSKDPFENLSIRKLTPLECERLQGFEDNFTEGVSNTQRYKLIGNAVTTNVITYLGLKILEVI